MKRLLLIRHTTPDALPGLCYGRLDLGLAGSYAAEKKELSAALQPLMETRSRDRWRVFASPLRRCRQLAEDLTGGPVCVAEDLIELDFGRWEGLLWSAIPKEESLPWTEDFVRAAPPGGESFETLERRARRFWQNFLASDTQCALAFSHSGVIRALRCLARGEGLERAFDEPLPYGAIFEMGG